MSESQDTNTPGRDDEDSNVDAIAAVALIAIAVVFTIFWVSNQ